MSSLTASVLIPSFGRPASLAKCLASLQHQTVPPRQVILVWQKQDTPTRDLAESCRAGFEGVLEVVHCDIRGVVPAENRALAAATSDIVLLIDDDAIAPSDWIERHLIHYGDPTVGAVGGPADNFHPDGKPFPKQTRCPVGQLAWFGKLHGNMYDHVPAWRSRSPAAVDHLVGYNLSLRRQAFDRFEESLKPYWQMFELDACLQVKARGYRVLFDYANVVEHHPTNTAYAGGRDGDLMVKIYNGAYNYACVLGKHSPWYLAFPRLAFLLAAGSVSSPGLLGALVAARRFGRPIREARILQKTWRHHIAGWRAGRACRRSQRRIRRDAHPVPESLEVS